MILNFECGEAAELYFHTPGAGSRKAVSYRRFASMAEAVSFVMNEITPRDRSSCFLEYGEQRLGYTDIRKLNEKLSGQEQIGERT